MSRPSASDLKPGRELDALVAEKVMGWVPWFEKRGAYTHVVWQAPEEPEPYRRSRDWQKQAERYRHAKPEEIDRHKHIEHLNHFRPGTSIADAWKVVEKLAADGWNLVLTINAIDDVTVFMSRGYINCPRAKEPFDPATGHGYDYVDMDDEWADAFGCVPATHAICLAALRAVGAIE